MKKFLRNLTWKADEFGDYWVAELLDVATVNVVLHNRLKPVLVDVDPLTYNIDTSLIEKAITPATVAIVVHLFGMMADMVNVCDVAWSNDLSIIEDSCETVGVYQSLGRHAHFRPGMAGDVACFSFYMAHHVQAGVGGISITDDKKLATNIIPVTGASWEYLDSFQDGSVDMVFVDGDHENVVQDYPWWAKVAPAGLMLFHDYSPGFPAVIKLVDEMAVDLGRPPDVLVVPDGGMAGFYKGGR